MTIAAAALAVACGASTAGSDLLTPSGGAGGSGAAGGNTSSAGGGGGRSSQIAVDGYITATPWMGYGFTATDPGAATLTPDCTNGCEPPFSGTTFCMQGTVTGRTDYSGFAMLGWNVNQAPGGDPVTWPVPATGGVTITVIDTPPTVALRAQLQGTDPHSSADRWCAPLVSGQFIPWTDFKTNCWTGGSPQNALTPGTPIQQAAVMVPGLLTDLPFDVCLVNVEITP
jgi:hypothetical protein